MRGGGVRTNTALILPILGVGVVTKEEIILSLLNFGPHLSLYFIKLIIERAVNTFPIILCT